MLNKHIIGLNRLSFNYKYYFDLITSNILRLIRFLSGSTINYPLYVYFRRENIEIINGKKIGVFQTLYKKKHKSKWKELLEYH